MNIRHVVLDSGLGPLTLVATDDAVSGLYFRRHIRRPPAESLGPEVPVLEDRLLADAATQVTEYLDGRRREFDLPLAPAGDDVQHAVWDLVKEIPFGGTTTYGRIAERLGDRRRAWEVGQAVGANPLCIVVPCHRVVGSGGALTGYAGGLKRKRALLELEEPAEVGAARLF
ncbi:methylated-DNA--[protein]-cysteine S-methyltransferase [Jiangella anatolica]|uniref:Methylated-DNA--protein-cysteine methyltransferase n=1 Tax=Jiangella anatolica TaxID=2670374 RepID=A0A2W2CGN8_9ACTN|nr:methylated-DNA--[protein]-cysteine S-methyltransferase [Jiangella anatolica]PZF79343.1 cysteine methyltransferase [Jiangella anatolica]